MPLFPRNRQPQGLTYGHLFCAIAGFGLLMYMSWSGVTYRIPEAPLTVGRNVVLSRPHAAAHRDGVDGGAQVPDLGGGLPSDQGAGLGAVDTRGGKSGDALREKAIRARAKAAILGAFVADAASMGLHWIYDTDTVRTLLRESNRIGRPEFFEPPSCPFYKYESGRLSPYGDEALPVLESMAEQGRLDPQHLQQRLYESFKAYEKNGGRLNRASKDMIRNVDSGKTFPAAGAHNNEAHATVKVPVVVGRYAGLAEMRDRMLDAVHTHQNNEQAETAGLAAALLLERVVLGDSLAAALTWASGSAAFPAQAQPWLAKALQSRFKDTEAAIGAFGQTCHLPDSFEGAMFIANHSQNYVQAVRDNIMAGGDCCGRSHLVAALFAAQGGLESIPEEWKDKTSMYHDLEPLVDDLLERRSDHPSVKAQT